MDHFDIVACLEKEEGITCLIMENRLAQGCVPEVVHSGSSGFRGLREYDREGKWYIAKLGSNVQGGIPKGVGLLQEFGTPRRVEHELDYVDWVICGA